MGRFEQAYLLAFLSAIVVCWSPSKAVPYVWPTVLICWLLVAAATPRLVRNVLAVSLAWVGIVSITALWNREFVFQNALIATMTYSTLALVLIVPTPHLASRSLYRKMSLILLVVVAVQGLVGTVQAAYAIAETGTVAGATGDAVEGTIDLALPPSGSLSNAIFATNMALALVCLIPTLGRTRRVTLAVYLVGTVAFVLASVMHVIIFLFAAVGAALVIVRPRALGRASVRALWVSLVFAGALVGTLLAPNLQLLAVYYDRIVRKPLAGEVSLATTWSRAIYARPTVVRRAMVELPREYPQVPLVGLGPGQFSSRAALIGTGLYFGGMRNPKSIPFLSPIEPKPMNSYLMELWRALDVADYPFGSTHKPFFSWLSVYTEFGALGVLLVCGAGLLVLVRLVRRSEGNSERKTFALATAAGGMFLFFMGAQENYWEVPQAILVGSLVLKVMYSVATDNRSISQAAVASRLSP